MTNSMIESETRDVHTFLGTRNRVLVTADESGGAFGAVEISVQPGAGAPLHTNTREALGYYGLEGTLSFVTDEGDRELRPGEFISLRKGGTHTFANKGEGSARALMIATPGGFEGFFAAAAAALPPDAPKGAPPPEVIAKLVEISGTYGMELK